MGSIDLNDLERLLGFDEPRDEREARAQRITNLALTFVLSAWVGLEVSARIWS